MPELARVLRCVPLATIFVLPCAAEARPGPTWSEVRSRPTHPLHSNPSVFNIRRSTIILSQDRVQVRREPVDDTPLFLGDPRKQRQAQQSGAGGVGVRHRTRSASETAAGR